MWMNNLKIAIVQQNTDAIADLIADIPKFSDISKMQEAMYLLKEASSLINKLKDDTSIEMRQVKKNIDFLKSVHSETSSKFDIIS